MSLLFDSTHLTHVNQVAIDFIFNSGIAVNVDICTRRGRMQYSKSHTHTLRFVYISTKLKRKTSHLKKKKKCENSKAQFRRVNTKNKIKNVSFVWVSVFSWFLTWFQTNWMHEDVCFGSLDNWLIFSLLLDISRFLSCVIFSTWNSARNGDSHGISTIFSKSRI